MDGRKTCIILFCITLILFPPLTLVSGYTLDPGGGGGGGSGGGTGTTYYGRIIVTVNMPQFAEIGSSIDVHINTYTTADHIEIYIDGSKKKTWEDKTSVTYTFTAKSYIARQHVFVVAWNARYDDFENVYLRLYYQSYGSDIVRDWFSRAHDYARSHSAWDSISRRRLVWDVAYQVLNYGDNSPMTSYEDGIGAFLKFAKDVLRRHWDKDSDALTAYEMAYYFRTFNGNSDNAGQFTATEHGGTFNCADFAAFLSGMATAMNMPSRMITISSKQDGHPEYNDHLIAEIYGLTTNGNNGWFLIDPGLAETSNGEPTSRVFSSYTDLNTVKQTYTAGGGTVYKFHFIWGMDSSQWGYSVGVSATTYWPGYGVPPNYLEYTANPWGISV